jgi:hypothetical protein
MQGRNMDSLEQLAVELGKVVAMRIIADLTVRETKLGHDRCDSSATQRGFIATRSQSFEGRSEPRFVRSDVGGRATL